MKRMQASHLIVVASPSTDPYSSPVTLFFLEQKLEPCLPLHYGCNGES
jgi:hypothetical protein